MISLARAKRSDRSMKAATTLTVPEFEALARDFGRRWEEQHRAHTAAGARRQRQPGGGRKGVLPTAELKLFFILFYYKAYPTQDLMGLLFGLTQGQVSDWVRRLTAAVGQLMPLHKPARTVRELHELLAREPALDEVIVDGTERRLPRPVRADRQRRYYSGRKKRHAIKNVIVTAQGKVRWVSRTRPARRHDKAVAEEDRLRLPAGVTVLGDSGFAGLDPGAADLITPWKKPKGGRLHWKRRDFNRLLSRERVKVEHTLASVKRLRILRDEFRNRRRGMVDEVMVIGCALHNYRWSWRQEAVAA
jgi:hypothetical protein